MDCVCKQHDAWNVVFHSVRALMAAHLATSSLNGMILSSTTAGKRHWTNCCKRITSQVQCGSIVPQWVTFIEPYFPSNVLQHILRAWNELKLLIVLLVVSLNRVYWQSVPSTMWRRMCVGDQWTTSDHKKHWMCHHWSCIWARVDSSRTSSHQNRKESGCCGIWTSRIGSCSSAEQGTGLKFEIKVNFH